MQKEARQFINFVLSPAGQKAMQSGDRTHGPPDRPATPFVARFTGLSGEFPVRVLGTATDGLLEVEPALGTGAAEASPFLARGHGRPLSAGTALLMVRPTGIQLTATGTGEHHLAGTVADVAFRGRGYEHAIDLPGHGRLTGVFSATRAARGENVGLRLDPAGCHVFETPGPGETQGPDEAGSGEARNPGEPHNGATTASQAFRIRP